MNKISILTLMSVLLLSNSFAKQGHKKIRLTTNEVSKIISTKGQDVFQDLNVYLGRDLVIEYRQTFEEAYDVENIGINEETSESRDKVLYPSDIKGRIIKASTNQLSVTFDKNCSTPDCALTFKSVKGQYFLADIPQRKDRSQSIVRFPNYDLDIGDKVELSPRLKAGNKKSVINSILGRKNGIYTNALFGKLPLKVLRSDIHKINKTYEEVQGF